MQRTPPKLRDRSFSWTGEDSDIGKRKRGGEDISGGEDKRKKEMEKLTKAWNEEIASNARGKDEFLSETEIRKGKAEKAQEDRENPERKTVEQPILTEREIVLQKELDDLRKENLALKRQLDELREKQCQNRNRNSLEEFEKEVQCGWKGSCVREKKGDVFASPDEYSLAHCVAKDLKMYRGIATQFRLRYGRIADLKKQQVKVGGVATINQATDCSGDKTRKNVFYLVTKEKSEEKPTVGDMLKSLNVLRDTAIKNGVNKIAVPRIGSGRDRLSWPLVRKMVEWVFEGAGIDVLVCTLDEEPLAESKVVTQDLKIDGPKIKPDAILVKAREGSTYAEILNAAKKGLHGKSGAEKFTSTRKTKEGDLLIELKVGQTANKEIESLVQQAIGKAGKVNSLEKRTLLRIRDLDETVTKEEISTALENDNIAGVQVRELKTGYRGKKLASINVTEDVAEKLLRKGMVKIGLDDCRVDKWLVEVRCYRCWELGHFAKDCKGADCTGLCRRCKKPGHRAADCKQEYTR